MNQRTGIFLGLGAAIIVAILLVVFVFAGGDDDDGKTAKAPSSGQPSTGQTTTGGNQPAASGEFAAVFNKFANQRSWRGQLTVEAPGQPSQQITFEFVAPDRYRIVTSAPGVGSFEVISIGNDSYIKTGTVWTKQAGAGIGQLFDVNDIRNAIQELSGYTKGGTETVAGKRCQVYTRTSGGESDEVCVADDLPVRFVNQSSGGKTTMIFTDYNANIDIRAPI